MNRIESTFSSLRAEGRTALMPFITGGYPSLEATSQVIPHLEQAGASVVEIGFPFSDPIADGPVIASSMHEALSQGVTPRSIFNVVRDVRADTGLGLVAMVSDSIIQRMGPESFFEQAAAAGFDGLIVPDLDLDRAGAFASLASGQDLTLTLLISQYSSPQRARRIVEHCTGFVYLLARAGITGERDAAPDIGIRVGELRRLTDLPIAAGFGISRPEHVRAVTSCADAAIVGSALVRRMGEAAEPVAEAASFVADLAGGLMSRPAESP